MPTICLVSRSKTKNLNADFKGNLNYVFHELPTHHKPMSLFPPSVLPFGSS